MRAATFIEVVVVLFGILLCTTTTAFLTGTGTSSSVRHGVFVPRRREVPSFGSMCTTTNNKKSIHWRLQYQQQLVPVLDERHTEIVDRIMDQFTNPNNTNNGTSTVKDAEIQDTVVGRGRASVILPTGWGKTVLALLVKRRMALAAGKQPMIQTAMYVTPFLKLADQTLDQLERFPELFEGIPHEVLLVASETSRPNQARTTDPQVIADFLAHHPQKKHQDGLRLLVVSRQSLPKVAQALKLLDEAAATAAADNAAKQQNQRQHKIGLGIFDEAHGMTGIAPCAGFGLHNDELPIDYRLFLTATPRNYASQVEQRTVLGKTMNERTGLERLVTTTTTKTTRNVTTLANSGEAIVSADNSASIEVEEQIVYRQDARSFDNPSLFGPTVEEKTYRDGVEQNISVPLTLCVVSRQDIAAVLGEGNTVFSDTDDLDWAPEELMPVVLQAAMSKFNTTHVVTFHNRNIRARQFSERLKTLWSSQRSTCWDTVLVGNVNSTMSRQAQEVVLRDAKEAPRSVLSNCRMLSTGVDEAGWDMVFLADSVRSDELTKQMIGRVSRPAPGKERGYVLVPLILDAEVDSWDDTSVASQSFVTAFRAMVDGDPVLRRDIVFVQDESKRLGRFLNESEYPDSLRQMIDFPASIPIELQHSIVRKLSLDSIRAISLDEKWNANFLLLKKYACTHGHCHVPHWHVQDGFSLGKWMKTQRTNRKAGILENKRVALLDEIGFAWDVLETQWKRNYQLLVQFKAREGHTDVPNRHIEDGAALGMWCQTQRKMCKRGTLFEERVVQLDSLGFVWDILETQWQRNFCLLVKFKAREGHTDVPEGHIEDGAALGRWCREQRVLYMHKRETLSEERAAQLDSLDFVWNSRETRWQRNYQLLVHFKAREGHADVPYRHIEDGAPLGTWHQEQRKMRKRGTLSEERITQLDSLGFVWDVLEMQWQRNYQLLVHFKAREGHTFVPKGHIEDGAALGRWCQEQRKVNKRGTLAEERAVQLDSLGFVWDFLETKWQMNFCLLVKFKAREGHTDVPKRHIEDGAALGIWCQTQRKLHNKGRLLKGRKMLLEEIGLRLVSSSR